MIPEAAGGGGTDLVLGQQSGELALLQDDHVLLYSGDLRHHSLKHDLLTSETQMIIGAPRGQMSVKTPMAGQISPAGPW